MNEANDAEKPLPAQSFDNLVADIHSGMDKVRGSVDGNKKEFFQSDRKKLLALPFLMTKHQELPEPKKGQKEWSLFNELYGREWDTFDSLTFDKEEKITEFTYENYISKHLLKELDTHSVWFKNLVKTMNMNTKTEYEQHKVNQEQFKQLMPVIA